MLRVSILELVYNLEKYIKQALDSIINRILKVIEFICAHGSSPDISFGIVKLDTKQ